MTATPSFAFVDETPARIDRAGLIRSVWRRLSWRAVLVALAASFGLNEVREIGQTFHARPNDQWVPPEMWLSGTVIVVTCALCILVAVLAADEVVDRGAPRLRSYATAVLVGAAVAGGLQYLIRLPLGLRTMVSVEESLIRVTQPVLVFCDFAILGGLATFVYVNLRTARRATARRQKAEITRLETRRRTLESQLQAMQARVEPQFLFNTLAQVRQLYDSDAAIAGRMLDDLIAYLRAALPHLRESSSTLGKEAELARAYLDIVRVRLGERLAFDIDVPAALADARMPPMMLLPLIDHVLVYGLEPSQAGGSIRIETNVGEGKLRLAITDSGAGFVPGGDAGDLKHIGERLYALYGDAAALRLERLQGAATKAILEIPYEPADRSDR